MGLQIMEWVTPAQWGCLKNKDLSAIANILERTAELMFERHTVDETNSLISLAVFLIWDEDEKADLVRSDDVTNFLHCCTDFWRARFRTVQKKVDAYLIAAAIARSYGEESCVR